MSREALYIPQLMYYPDTNAGSGAQVSDGNKHNLDADVKQRQVDTLRRSLKEAINTIEYKDLGDMVVRTDIQSIMNPKDEGFKPFHTLPEYRTEYPQVITDALARLFLKYNESFRPLVYANREWDTDYQYAMVGPNHGPVNRWAQIDMVGLPQGFLDKASSMDIDAVESVLKGNIFEFENSIAMYHLLENINRRDGNPSMWDHVFRRSLQELREKHNKEVALLAVTEPKYEAMKASEFGKRPGEPLSSDEVHKLTGFDHFFGPNDYIKYLEEHAGESPILFVRSSDPVARLKKPGNKDVFDHTDPQHNPLLTNSDLRRIIKAHSITFNIDRPGSKPGSPDVINDTKKYLATMGMAHRAVTETDIFTITERGKGIQPLVEYSSGIKDLLISQGFDEENVAAGNIPLRAKPEDASYGCYGHLTLRPQNGKDRQELRKFLIERGSYTVQPELVTPTIVNTRSGQEFTYIDRNFVYTPDGKTVYFMGGFRSLMPIDTVEAQQRRVHGNGATHWAEVY